MLTIFLYILLIPERRDDLTNDVAALSCYNNNRYANNHIYSLVVYTPYTC